MICPHCKMKMEKHYCKHCGYMSNGNFIRTKHQHISDIEKILGEDFQKVVKNQNKKTLFFEGPLYFCYRDFFWIGFLLECCDLLGYYFAISYGSAFFAYGRLSLLPGFMIFYFCLNRYFWMTLGNHIYLWLLKRKIKKTEKMNTQEKEQYLLQIKAENYLKLRIAIYIFLLPLFTFLLFKVLTVLL